MKYKLVTSPINENYQYVEMTDTDGQVWVVPIDESNPDYRNYLATLEETA